MSGVNWTPALPILAPANYALGYALTRVSGGASDGSLDSFQQVSLSGIIAAAQSGNIATATALQSARSITSTGDIGWTVSFDGSENVSAAATIAVKSVSNAKLADVPANTLKGATVAGSPQDLGTGNVRSMLSIDQVPNYTQAQMLSGMASYTGAYTGTAASVDAPAGTNRVYNLKTGGSVRWQWGASSVAEAGGNAGSNWFLNAFDDGGNYLSTPMTVNRATGQIGMAVRPFFGIYTPWDSGNFTPAATSISYNSGDTGAVSRTVKAWMRERGVSVTDFGAVADSNGKPGNGTDNLAAFQAAFNSGARNIYIPCAPLGKCYRLSAEWTVTEARKIYGDGAEPYKSAAGANLGARGLGSWLYFDHAGRGIALDPSASGLSISSGQLTGIGTIRNQPASASGWSPASNDFDLTFLGGDWWADNICLYNPTNGINHNYAGFGRLRLGYIFGDPFFCGIRVDRCYDVFRVEGGVHFWPFSGIDNNHRAYKYANLVGLDMRHCDEAFINDFFVGGAYRGVSMSGGADGQPPRDIQFGKLTVDLCGYAGIVVDSSVQSGGSLSVDNFVTQGAVSGDGNTAGAFVGVVIAAPGFISKINHARYTRFNQEMVIVTGAASTHYQGPATLDTWNQSSVSAPAFSVTGSGSKIYVTVPPTVINAGGPLQDGSGRVLTPAYAAMTG